ncbi:MAG: isoleucine--tRNA ligase [Candidatus Nanoarchaeia archaeon]
MQNNIKDNYSFLDIQDEMLTFWRAHKQEIDELIADKNTTNKERYSFLEGPPTANAPPGLHHVEMRVFKDLFTRFKTLQGYKVSRKGGWDCHGLPVEVQVEKKLGLKDKKAVIDYGVDKFIAQCKQDVFSFIDTWSESTEKLGFWLDLDNPYKTLNTNFMESEWWALSEMYKKDLLYKGHKIVPYCARCGTPLSSHEVAQGYKDVEEQSVIITFPAKDQNFFKEKGIVPKEKTADGQEKPVVFLAWTTTPWTLPSNLALAVHPEVEYACVETDNEIFVLAKDLVETYFPKHKPLGTLLGEFLVGQLYEPLFDYFKETATNSFRIIPADYVTTQDGTGIVHLAPAYGEEDNVVCVQHNIDFVNPVDDAGEFTAEVSDYQGQFVKDADKQIIQDLDARARLFKALPYLHSYPFCWRCKTPLIYYAKETWFIKVSAVKDKLIQQNETINWHPQTIKHGRFGNWLEGARDWALSRNKFWGTPLPIWLCQGQSPTGNGDQGSEQVAAVGEQCSSRIGSSQGSVSGCGHREVIGSIEELKEKTGTLVDDLHIASVDPLTFACPKCGGVMKRTPEVIDCWFDSGSAPFAQLHYPFENKELFDELYPYDFIAEAIDQTRGWFYTLLVINTILFDKAPYKNVAVGGLLCDDNGEKMSKSKGNIIKPNETFDKYGVDAVRLAMASYSLGNSIKFGESIFKEQIIPFFSTLYNSVKYLVSYTQRFNLTGKETRSASRLEDAWILSKKNSLVGLVTQKLEHHEYNKALEEIMFFVQNTFSKTYIKLIRERSNQKDEELAFVFRSVLEDIVVLLAPFTPYISEYFYQQLLKEDGDAWSVHVSLWPKQKETNPELEKEFDTAQHIIQGILAARDRAKIGVRWPLLRATVVGEVSSLPDSLLELIKTQTNVYEIVFACDFDVRLQFKIDYKKLGTAFGTQTGDIIPLLKKEFDRVSQDLQTKDSTTVGDFTITKDFFTITKEVQEPFVMGQSPAGEIYLDTTQTPELLSEGYAREITRRIQDLRKTAGLQKEDTITLRFFTDDEILKNAFQTHKDFIVQKVGAQTVEFSNNHFDNVSQAVVKKKPFSVSLEQLT